MAKQRQLSLSWPAKGLDKRGSYEQQAPYSTPDALNVWTDDRSEGRERGGSRPGLGKTFSQQISGSSARVRLVDTVQFIKDGERETILVASAGGELWYQSNASTMSKVANGVDGSSGTLPTLASDRLLVSAPLRQKLYIADNGDGSDTLVDSGELAQIASGTAFTSVTSAADSTPKNFETLGVNANDHCVVILSRGTGTNEIQTIAVDGTPTGGTFYLTFNGSRTTDLAYNADAATIQAALLKLSSIGKDDSGNNNVSCSGGALPGTPVTVTFQNDLGGQRVPLITASDNELTGGGTNEVQTITQGATGGTFNLKVIVDGQVETTAPIAWNAAASAVESAIEALSIVPSGEASGGGGALNSAPVTITFSGSLGSRDVAILAVDSAGLTGGTKLATVAETTKGINTDIRVSRSTRGKTGRTVTGAFEIASVSGTTITLATSPNAESVSGLKYRIARTIKVYDPENNKMYPLFQDWLKGSVPTNCTTIAAWRNRLVCVEASNPQNFKMSRQGDTSDWDYSADDAQRSIVGSLTAAGQIGEPIVALVPYHHNCLVIGCTSSLWIMTGDPAMGGTARRLDDQIGMLGPKSWCLIAGGYMMFMSRDGLYVMPPGCGTAPTSVSRELLPEELINIDTSSKTVTMAYDIRYRGVHLFIHGGSNTFHWFIDIKTRLEGDKVTAAFWPVSYQVDHVASSCHTRRDFTSNESPVVFGSHDGYLRHLKPSLDEDDGSNAISSHIVFGPFSLGDSTGMFEGKLSSICAALGQNSGDVTWSVHVGQTAEDAVDAAARESGIWKGYAGTGLQYRAHPKARGSFATVKITSAGT